MKRNKLSIALCHIILMMGLTFTVANAQEDSLYHEHLEQNRIDIEHAELHYSTIQYENSVDLLIHINSSKQRDCNILINLMHKGVELVRKSVSQTEDFVVVENLPKEANLDIQLINSNTGASVMTNIFVVNTSEQTEEIYLTDDLYKKLIHWSSTEEQTQKLTDFILQLDGQIETKELVYFVQKHYNIPYVIKSNNGNDELLNYFPIWPPNSDPDTGGDGGDYDDDVAGPRNDCNCSFVQNTGRNITPGNENPDGSISEDLIVDYAGGPEETWYTLEGKGAAKRMKLAMNGKHGSGKYEASTTGVGTDYSAGSPFYSRISYNFICTAFGSDLPEDCECPKDIWIEYSYTTAMKTKVEKGGGTWVWSAGGEAVVEDHAMLIIRNGEDVSIEDAGRARLATHCESNWNTEWWTNAAELVVAAVGVAIDTTSTAVSWVGLADDFVNVLSTSFFVGEGDCTDKNQHGNLLSGKRKITMTTNNPVDIVLSSFGYEFVRGYGKWRTRSSMVSDYALSTVLLGEDDIESGCCSHKVADYFTGSFDEVVYTLPWPPISITIADASFNDQSSLTDKVSTHFQLWAPFDDLERDFKGDYILDAAFGHFVQESEDCFTPIDPFNDDNNTEIRSINRQTFIYPNPANEILILDINYIEATIFDLSGRKIKTFDTPTNSVDISTLSSGQYMISVKLQSGIKNYKFVKI